MIWQSLTVEQRSFEYLAKFEKKVSFVCVISERIL